MTRFLVQALLVIVVFVAAWRTGGKPERYVATIYFSMLAATTFHAYWAPPIGPGGVHHFHRFRAWLDVAALVGVVLVALRYDRWWTLWVGSAQLLAVMAHLLRAIEMPIPLLAYAVMERWPVWMAVLVTGLGIYCHHRRQSTQRPDTT
jgi:hypothetical protein